MSAIWHAQALGIIKASNSAVPSIGSMASIFCLWNNWRHFVVLGNIPLTPLYKQDFPEIQIQIQLIQFHGIYGLTSGFGQALNNWDPLLVTLRVDDKLPFSLVSFGLFRKNESFVAITQWLIVDSVSTPHFYVLFKGLMLAWRSHLFKEGLRTGSASMSMSYRDCWQCHWMVTLLP